MIKAQFEKHILKFKIPAGTSRGTLQDRPIWIIKVWDEGQPQIIGIGECAPLVKLSIDDRPDFESKLSEICANISHFESMDKDALLDFPSIRFGLEMAFLDLKHGGIRQYFGNEISPTIPINGLIWMGDFDFMKKQIDQKLSEDWKCIKIKIGAIDFDKELKLLEYIRTQSKEVELRVDANGAFNMENVYDKLQQLSVFDLHSIEQPIATKQWDDLRMVCQKSPIPVGLDEELIGIYNQKKVELLEAIKPQYIVLKPTLLGGFDLTLEWIELAEKRNIGWWITSTLESNIGLNALTQYTAQFNTKMFQGLGTGMLFENNL